MTANTDLTKKPYQQERLTQQQIRDLAQCAHDPKFFIRNFCYIQHPTKGRVPFTLFDYQDELIDIYHENRYSISMLARQMGKSTCAGAYLLWYAMFQPDSTILIAAHKYSGAQEIMSRIRYMYESCPDHIRAGVTAYNKGSLEFDNGSRIVAQSTTENTGRGMSLTLVYLDEFAFVQPRIASEFWTSLSPTLSTGGKCLITSTPNNDDDQFATIWKQAEKCVDEWGHPTPVGINGFKSYLCTWERHPDRDKAWADEEEGKIGEERFKREHNCEFIAYDETLINSLKLATMEGVDVWKKSGQVRWYHPPEANFHTFIVGLDPCLGTGGDYAAIQVYGLPGMKQVAEWQHNKTSVQGQVRILKQIVNHLQDENPDSEIYWSVENNTLGEAAVVVITESGEDEFAGTFISEPKGRGKKGRRGFTTTHKSKIECCAKIKQWIEKDKMEVASKNFLRELKYFIARGNSFAAKDGEHDDLVMSALLVVRMTEIVAYYDDEAFDELRENLDDGDDDYGYMPMPIGL